MTFRRQRFQLGNESPVVVEQLLRLITAHPLFQHLQVCRIGSNICYRDLVRAPVALEVVLAHLPRGRPTFRATEYDHWPSRQHCSIGDRIEKFVTMPARGERAGFSLAVTNHYQSDKVWVVVNSPVSVRDAVAKFTALVNASGRFRSGVAADSAGERKLFKET